MHSISMIKAVSGTISLSCLFRLQFSRILSIYFLLSKWNIIAICSFLKEYACSTHCLGKLLSFWCLLGALLEETSAFLILGLTIWCSAITMASFPLCWKNCWCGLLVEVLFVEYYFFMRQIISSAYSTYLTKSLWVLDSAAPIFTSIFI